MKSKSLGKINIVSDFDPEINLIGNFGDNYILLLLDNIPLNIKRIYTIDYTVSNLEYHSSCISIETKKKSNKLNNLNKRWKSCKINSYTLYFDSSHIFCLIIIYKKNIINLYFNKIK